MVLFEDVHWAEPTFLELIEYLAGAIRGVPILIVAVARHDLLDARPDFGGVPAPGGSSSSRWAATRAAR